MFFTVLAIHVSVAQDRDTNYIDPYTKLITGRAFLSQKYTLFVAEGTGGNRDIQYRPNTKLSVGLGATYRALTLNVGYGLGFFTNEKERGKTRYLDLQTHLYGTKWRLDLFGQFYKGYYVFPRGFGAANSNSFYLRPDLNVQEIGLNTYYINNNKRFSYRAAFLQSEWQKKSAGSFLFGGGAVYGNIRADSAFVPSSLAANYKQSGVQALRYFELGPGAGYAYTFVWKQHWFATASATASLDLGFVRESFANGSESKVSVSPNFLFRAGLGYNSSTWNANLSWVTSRTAVVGSFSDNGYHVNTGNYRLTVAKRFEARRGLRRMLDKVDRVLDRLGVK